MSEVPTPEQIFEDLYHGLEPHPWGRDPYGVDNWEYVCTVADLVQANEILQQHGMEPAERITFDRSSEFTQLSGNMFFSPAQEIVSVSLYDGRLIRFYSFTKYDDTNEIFVKKDVQVEDDNIDLVNTLRAIVSGIDPNKELREYALEMHEISEAEMLALGGLIKILDRGEGS